MSPAWASLPRPLAQEASPAWRRRAHRVRLCNTMTWWSKQRFTRLLLRSLAQRVNLLLHRVQRGIVMESLLWLPERLVAGTEIDVGHGIIRGLRDGPTVGGEGLAVALLLVVHEAEIVVGMGIRGAEGDGTEIGRF